MEGVSSVMPLAVKAGTSVLSSALKGELGGSSGRISSTAEARAEQAENQARRQAEAVARGARDQVSTLREDNEHKRASARVAAANSGLTLSGSTLLNLTSLERAGDDKVNDVMHESALREQSILDSGAEQAQSIRLSGRVATDRLGGLGSLLRLGGQAQSPAVFTYVPTRNF
ncbi:MAG: hypothetical protein AUJ49_13585 [Desulfovibrionaceae bacterium CG1_02_65_16]|nr:MAG: hypothetical protein AUJ49_13585 [Desulfovibrionaceae bacterium CG1_02_65_16]